MYGRVRDEEGERPGGGDVQNRIHTNKSQNNIKGYHPEQVV